MLCCTALLYIQGLDPASRRVLWNAIKRSKPGRGILLTTHSMEEAEVLCDRLGICVGGRLVCIGHPNEVASRHAGFLVLTLTVPAGQEAHAHHLVSSMAPGVRPTYSIGGTLKYELPRSEVRACGRVSVHLWMGGCLCVWRACVFICATTRLLRRV
jgi:ABC-type glutathione transport system ATPase component